MRAPDEDNWQRHSAHPRLVPWIWRGRPEIEVSEHWVTTTFKRESGQGGRQVTGEVTGEVWLQLESLKMRVLTLLSYGPMANIHWIGAEGSHRPA